MAITIFVAKIPVEFFSRFVNNSAILYRGFWILAVIILVAIGGIVYLLLMIEMGGIRRYDIESVSPKLYKIMPKAIRKRMH